MASAIRISTSNSSVRTLLVATTNRGKLEEIAPILDGVPFEILTLADFPGVAAPEETGRTFAENARAKALYYAHATGELTVAEDSGLEIDALGGAPGVESARYGGAARFVSARNSRSFTTRSGRTTPSRARRDSSARWRSRSAAQPAFRNRRHDRRPNRRRTERGGRLRVRSDLLLPAVRRDAGRSRRAQVDGQPPRTGVPRPSALSSFSGLRPEA